ncbi:FtsW/RodA/SpoVE family cell cycle protein [Pseudoprevotella muciniphila]|uniref:Probable peptidoglycan glycosyltransferase FtsW n=1 Tax=Pseudoprevotella muciniphila TaxID=2133944 RepID=A0A5P8E830_9BACT|nr:FtsW/RodA/SpoVE family cell cycle protein [Pseudoprevotella muciniphila]QFQ13189.1 FtsW/RodA/SpoVE family cell cycle protein [Pseudoprevotella muciniphila]
MTKITSRGIFKGDPVIWTVFFFLCIISLIEVYSAASTLTYKTKFWMPLVQQAMYLGLGTFLVILIHNIPCRFFKTIPLPGLPAICLMLIFVLFFSEKVNEGARWINVFGFQFQPSELAKGIVVVSVALCLSFNQKEEGADPRAFKIILVITGFVCLLIFSENFSTAAILFAVVMMMMFVGRIPMKRLLALLGVIFGTIAVAFILLVSIPKDSKFFDTLPRMKTWATRVQNFGKDSKPEDPAKFQLQEHAQVGHAKIAIATSGFLGKGPGKSVERDFLSQAYSDFIYAIIIEEFGLLGGGIVLLLYIILLFRSAIIARRCERNFPAFLILGLALLIVFQAFINMGVAVGLLPVTGQNLPLISRGGTSIVCTSIYIGMMLSVSRYAQKTKKKNKAAIASEENDEEIEE